MKSKIIINEESDNVKLWISRRDINMDVDVVITIYPPGHPERVTISYMPTNAIISPKIIGATIELSQQTNNLILTRLAAQSALDDGADEIIAEMAKARREQK